MNRNLFLILAITIILVVFLSGIAFPSGSTKPLATSQTSNYDTVGSQSGVNENWITNALRLY